MCAGGGKSTYLFQVTQRLLDSGVPRQSILYLNFFDDRLHQLRRDHLGVIVEAYYSQVPKSAVAEYLEWFEDAYFLFTVRLFDPSLARSQTNPKKVYCIDHALVTSVSSGILVNSGHLLENLVFTALRRLHPEIHYVKTRTGREVDFVIPVRGRPYMLVQVCESLADPRTRQRETAALTDAMAELDLDTGIIVTRNEDERLDAEAGTIRVVPAWRFLLDLPESAEGPS